MAALNSRDGLLDYAYRRLGEPVIDINVDRQQAEERLDDALQFFTKDVVSVVKVFRFGQNSTGMFDVRYQMALNDYFGINRNLFMGTGQGIASFDSTKRYISLIEQLFEPEKQIKFNKVTNRLHIDMDWSEDATVGKYIVIEAYVALSPTIFTEIYNDILLKKYFTALIKRQWGANLSKFDNVALPGGATMRGGEEEIIRLEEEVRLTYELPIDFTIG